MRGKKAPIRNIKPDNKYGDMHIAKFINCFMYGGNKIKVTKIFYNVLESLAQKNSCEPLHLFHQVLKNCSPTIKTSAKRIGGGTYHIPRQIPQQKQSLLGIKIILSTARNKVHSDGISISKALDIVIGNAYNGTGPAIEKKNSIEEVAHANAAFAQYRW